MSRNRNRGRRRSSGERRPDYDRIAQLEAQLADARAAEDADLDERIGESAPPPQRGDQDKPKFIHHRGERFRLPEAPDLDIDVIEAFEQGKSVTAVKGLLGDASVARIRAMHGGRLSARDLEPVLEQIARVYGFTSVGESGASSG